VVRVPLLIEHRREIAPKRVESIPSSRMLVVRVHGSEVSETQGTLCLGKATRDLGSAILTIVFYNSFLHTVLWNRRFVIIDITTEGLIEPWTLHLQPKCLLWWSLPRRRSGLLSLRTIPLHSRDEFQIPQKSLSTTPAPHYPSVVSIVNAYFSHVRLGAADSG
jgi:hypothetical protein